MNLKYLRVLLLVQVSLALITKNFEKILLNTRSVIDYKELASIPQMDFFECAYFCMKVGEECTSFYITKEGSCRRILTPKEDLVPGSPDDPKSAILFTTEPVPFSKSFIQIH